MALVRRRRRQTFEQRRRWSMVKVEAGKQRWLLVAANATLLIPTALVLALLPAPPVWNGLIAGALIASAFWMSYGVLLIRTYPVSMGEWGESFTREFLDWGRHRAGGSSTTSPWSVATSTTSPSRPQPCWPSRPSSSAPAGTGLATGGRPRTSRTLSFRAISHVPGTQSTTPPRGPGRPGAHALGCRLAQTGAARIGRRRVRRLRAQCETVGRSMGDRPHHSRSGSHRRDRSARLPSPPRQAHGRQLRSG